MTDETPQSEVVHRDHQVLLVSIPDNKEALYLDGELVIEAQWISAQTLINKLIHRGVIAGGKVYAEEKVLNDVGQFPRRLPKVRLTRYP